MLIEKNELSFNDDYIKIIPHFLSTNVLILRNYYFGE